MTHEEEARQVLEKAAALTDLPFPVGDLIADAIRVLDRYNEKPKRWKPQNKEYYWFMNGSGDVYVDIWADSNDADQKRYKIGNCYKTKEECEFAVECRLVEAELQNFADEHNSHQIMWHNDTANFNLYYDHTEEKIEVDMYYMIQQQGVLFTSEEVARAAIEAIGEDRLRKYYFKVKEVSE